MLIGKTSAPAFVHIRRSCLRALSVLLSCAGAERAVQIYQVISRKGCAEGVLKAGF